MKELVVDYRVRHYIGDYKAIDYKKKLKAVRWFWNDSGGLLYAFTDRYNVTCIEKDFIDNMTEVEL